jgi:hypothetical protein
MNRKEWTTFMMGFIDGVKWNLAASAPKMAGLQLEELRKRVCGAATAQARKSCERRMDRLGESTSFSRAACRRLIGERADIAVDGMEQCVESMIRLAQARGDKRAERGIRKILGDFQKKWRKPIYKPIHGA